MCLCDFFSRQRRAVSDWVEHSIILNRSLEEFLRVYCMRKTIEIGCKVTTEKKQQFEIKCHRTMGGTIILRKSTLPFVSKTIEHSTKIYFLYTQYTYYQLQAIGNKMFDSFWTQSFCSFTSYKVQCTRNQTRDLMSDSSHLIPFTHSLSLVCVCDIF